MTPDEVGPGQTFGGYRVLEELGRGGMGRVFRARHVTLERDVALKLLAEQFTEDEFYVQRFLKEARAAARLNHPGHRADLRLRDRSAPTGSSRWSSSRGARSPTS